MKQAATWQSIRAEGLRRIHDGLWAPGARIPDEADLAGEFGCARATVNRALRSLAEDGFLERRRKGGTRVALTPVRKARRAGSSMATGLSRMIWRRCRTTWLPRSNCPPDHACAT